MYLSFSYYYDKGWYVNDNGEVPLTVLKCYDNSDIEEIYPYYSETLKTLEELGCKDNLSFDPQNIPEGFVMTVEKQSYTDRGESFMGEPEEVKDAQTICKILEYAFAASADTYAEDSEENPTSYWISYKYKSDNGKTTTENGFWIYGEEDFIEEFLTEANNKTVIYDLP